MNIQMAGIRNIEDAVMCTECGVNIIGLLVGQAHTSDDFISKELARDIKLALPNNIKTTLITHLENAEQIIDRGARVASGHLYTIQINSELIWFDLATFEISI